VSELKSAPAWNTIAMRTCSRVSSEAASWSLTSTRPEVGSSRPTICLSRTLLPEPLGPIRTKISPGSMSRETSFSTWRLPKSFVTCSSFTPTAGLSSEVKGLRVWLQGMGGLHQGLGDEVIEHEDDDEGDHDRAGDGGADLARAAAGVQADVAAHGDD